MKPDQELIEQSLSGSHEAYGELVSRYEKAVFGAAAAVLKDFNDVQDAAQETFLIAYRKLGQLRDAGAFGRWVIRIGRSQAMKLLGRRKATVPLDDESLCVLGSNHKVAAPTGGLLQAVMKLPDSQREAILMRYFGGLSVAEIAQATGNAVGSVTSRLSRAYENLRARLGEYEE